MPMQEFLASYAVEVDESGVKRLQEALKTDRELAEALAGAFDAARDSLKSLDASLDALDVRAALREKLQISDLPTLDLAAELDITEATSAAETWMAQVEAMRPKLKVNTSGMTTAVSSAVSSIRSMLSSLSITVPVRAVVTLDTSGLPDGGSDDSGNSGEERGGSGSITIPAFANGGRIDSPTVAMIGEESEPEYVIPVNKEERAVPLVRDLLSEMSEPAKESVFDEEENEPEKESEAKQEEVPSVRESFFSSKSVTPITDLFNHDEETETPSVSDVGSVPMADWVLPAAEEALHEEDVSAASEAGRPVISSTPETEAVPLVQESLPEAEVIPTEKETIHISEKIFPVMEALMGDQHAYSVESGGSSFISLRRTEEPFPRSRRTEEPSPRSLPEQPIPVSVKDIAAERSGPVSVRTALKEKAHPRPISSSPVIKEITEQTVPPANETVNSQRVKDILAVHHEYVSSEESQKGLPEIIQPNSFDENRPEIAFPPVTNQAKEMDLTLIQNAIADLNSMKLPKAMDAKFAPEMLRELTDVARSQFLPAGVAVPAASHSVEAPVTIQVNSPYASPEEVGRSVYDLTQRYLLRTMKGVFA